MYFSVCSYTCDSQYTSRRYFSRRRFSISLFHFLPFSFFLSHVSRLFFPHFPGPLVPEEDISFHSVITGEPNLHNTRIARALPPFTFYFNRGNRSNRRRRLYSPATAPGPRRARDGDGSRSASWSVGQSRRDGSGTLNKNKVCCGRVRADALAIEREERASFNELRTFLQTVAIDPRVQISRVCVRDRLMWLRMIVIVKYRGILS